MKMLMDNCITLDVYLKYVMPLYELEKKKKVKKNTAVAASSESESSDSAVQSDKESNETDDQ